MSPIENADLVPNPPPIDIEGMHSTFCGTCGGWGGSYIERINDNSWFLYCFGCNEILLSFRGLKAVPLVEEWV